MTDLRTAAQQALEALEEINKLSIGENAICLPAEIDGAINALRERMAQPEQEPVALFKWLPEGTTHIGRISVRTCAGGSLAMSTHAFKYDADVLKVYVTDNDNEYPNWRKAKDVFFHLNFPVQPLYTTPPQRKPLTHPQIHELDWPDGMSFDDILRFIRAIEAAHGIKGEA